VSQALASDGGQPRALAVGHARSRRRLRSLDRPHTAVSDDLAGPETVSNTVGRIE
jgi:hypothetical protein